MPGSFGAFDRMTELPDEPFTAGMNVGPGAGREALVRGVQYTQDDELVAQLRGLYAAFPTTDVARLLQAAEAQANQRGM
jgi:hypothetical protein